MTSETCSFPPKTLTYRSHGRHPWLNGRTLWLQITLNPDVRANASRDADLAPLRDSDQLTGILAASPEAQPIPIAKMCIALTPWMMPELIAGRVTDCTVLPCCSVTEAE